MSYVRRLVFYVSPFLLGAASNTLIGWMFVVEKNFDNPILIWISILVPGIFLQIVGVALLALLSPAERSVDIWYAVLTVIGVHCMLLLVDPVVTGGWLVHGTNAMLYLPSILYYGVLFLLSLLFSHRTLRLNMRKESLK